MEFALHISWVPDRMEESVMRKFVLILAIAFSCIGFMTIHAASWYWIGADTSGGQWYVDNQSAQKSYSIATIWVKRIEENGSYTVTLEEITRDHKEALVQVIRYDANGHVVSSWNAPFKEYSVIVPESMGEAIYNSVW